MEKRVGDRENPVCPVKKYFGSDGGFARTGNAEQWRGGVVNSAKKAWRFPGAETMLGRSGVHAGFWEGAEDDHGNSILE